jgi:hypothetical protein
MTDALSPAPAPLSAASIWQRRIRRCLPWFSLITGVAGALTMDRGPRHATLVAIAAVVVWLTLIALHWLARRDQDSAGPRKRRLIRLARGSSLMATQSLVQLALFFALPFYVQAAALRSWHLLFLLVLGGLSLASLWDPLTEWALTHRLFTPLLPAMASFAALDVVLPGLGLSTRQSLWLAAGTAVLGVAALTAAASHREQRWRRSLRALLVALLLPAALAVGFTRIVPAAPLRLVRIELGTQVVDHWVTDPVEQLSAVPERLFCATAIGSPVGVKDKLFHVWSKNGASFGRIELAFSGGRAAGYRTYSRVAPWGSEPAGDYRCSVETAAGQVLGSQSVRVR